MKRICFFSGDITRSGGTERVATMVANELVRQGRYEVCFLSLCELKKTPFFEIDEKITRYRLGEKWIQPGLGYLPLVPQIRRFFKEKNIDIVIDIDIVLDILSIPASYGRSVKVISWEHFNYEFEMSVAYRKAILKFSVKQSDYVITLTKKDKENYEQKLRRTKNIEFIYNPMEEVGDLQDEKRENRIITVGRLVPEKGMEYLAEVATKVLTEQPDWKWYVLGDGEERRYLERVIAEKHLEEQMILTGLVSNVGDYLKKSKLFVLTSKSEGLGMCLLEAKAYNLPCISFDVPTGPGEVIEEGISGFLIEPFDCEAMVAQIGALIKDEERLMQLAEHAKGNIEKFQMKNIMEKWNRVLESICE